MNPKLIDLQKQTAVVTSTATVNLGLAVAGFQTLASHVTANNIAVGDVAPFFIKNPANGAFVAGYFTVASPTQLTLQQLVRSSNNNQDINFAGATCEVYCSAVSDFLMGTDLASYMAANPSGTVLPADLFLMGRGGASLSAIAAAVALIIGSGTPAPVDNPPTLSAISVSGVTATSATGTVTTNETGGTLYWLFSTASTATAAQVKAGQSKAVSATGAQSLPSPVLTASTAYYLHVLHRDTAPQDSAVLSLASPFTTQAAGTPAPTVTAVNVSPSSTTLAGAATQAFTAAVVGANSPSQAVNWTCVGGGSINASGLYTAPAATSQAQAITITATSVQDSSKTGTASVTIAAVAAPAPGMADAYVIKTSPTPTDPAYSFCAVPAPSTATLATLGYVDVQTHVRILNKTDASAPPAATAIQFVWHTSNTVAPTAAQITAYSNTGNRAVVNAGIEGAWTDANHGTYWGQYTSASMYLWRTGTFYLWAIFPDGSGVCYDNGTGNPANFALVIN